LNEPSSAKRRAKENTRAALLSPAAKNHRAGINAFLEDNGVKLPDMHQVTVLARSALPHRAIADSLREFVAGSEAPRLIRH
jgi:hypothetical protein